VGQEIEIRVKKKKEQDKMKKQDAKLKKKEKIKIRNDHLDELEEEFEEVPEFAGDKSRRQIPPIREMLMTPLGVLAMTGFLASAFVLISFTFFDPYGTKKKGHILKWKRLMKNRTDDR